jgi:SAM-dependent methyltransferase
VSSSRSTAEQEAFLRAFHGRNPGVTSRAFARGRSYAAVVDAVLRGGRGRDARLADLGCGDGHLLTELRRGGFAGAMCGIDLSEAELALARARVPDAHFVLARAQELPIVAGAFDTVVSHLAFTLMADVDEVVRELARVLVPGGRFITVVGGGPRGDDAFAGFLALARPWMTRIPRLGERRARSDAGLAALFGDGWTALTVDDLPVDLSGSPDEVWETMAGIYELDGLEDERLRRTFVTECDRWRRDGVVACTMATWLVQVVRTG